MINKRHYILIIFFWFFACEKDFLNVALYGIIKLTSCLLPAHPQQAPAAVCRPVSTRPGCRLEVPCLQRSLLLVTLIQSVRHRHSSTQDNNAWNSLNPIQSPWERVAMVLYLSCFTRSSLEISFTYNRLSWHRLGNGTLETLILLRQSSRH